METNFISFSNSLSAIFNVLARDTGNDIVICLPILLL